MLESSCDPRYSFSGTALNQIVFVLLLDHYGDILYWVFWCKNFIIFTVIFQQWNLYNRKYLFYIGIDQKKSQNSEIITTQIGTHTENNENVTCQISITLYSSENWQITPIGRQMLAFIIDSEKFYFALLCSILFCFIMFYFILFRAEHARVVFIHGQWMDGW